jgi:hypothetical protein
MGDGRVSAAVAGDGRQHSRRPKGQRRIGRHGWQRTCEGDWEVRICGPVRHESTEISYFRWPNHFRRLMGKKLPKLP